MALLERDHKTEAALVRGIEIIGEAANKIQQQTPELVKASPLKTVAENAADAQ